MIHSVLAADVMGRFDHHSLDQQTRMELLVERIPSHIIRSRAEDGETVKDACDWFGVVCNPKNEVEAISWTHAPVIDNASCNLDFLPDTVHSFNIFSSNFHGTLETSRLPNSIRFFQIAVNQFSGELDLTSLPDFVELFNVHANNFVGSADLTNLPATLRELVISKNHFSGEVKLTNLPPNLSMLFFHYNRFRGALCLTNLPPKLQILNASHNRFNGTVVVKNLPPTLHKLLLEGNTLQRVEVKEFGEATSIFLENNPLVEVVDSRGNVFAHGRVHINASY